MLQSGIFYYNHLAPQAGISLLLVTFLLWNCVTDFALKYDLAKMIFKWQHQQPAFQVHVTAYLLFTHHTGAHQTSNSISFMCSLAAHSPVNKWHIVHTFPVFNSHCVTPANQTSSCYVTMNHDSTIARVSSNEGHGDKGEKLHSQNLWLSLWYWWRCLSSTIWCHVDWWTSYRPACWIHPPGIYTVPYPRRLESSKLIILIHGSRMR